jgi:uncharacterized OB-fold protein
VTDDLVPGLGDPLTQQFWEAAAEGKLLVQHCEGCGRDQLYPRPFCTACGSDDLGWCASSRKGAVYSLTTVRLPVDERVKHPYDVALVELAEGPRLLAFCDHELEIGEQVEVRWSPTPHSAFPVLRACSDLASHDS